MHPLTRRMLDGDLPTPLYAVVGLADQVTSTTRDLVTQVTNVPGSLVGEAQRQYESLVERGQSRSVEIAAERAVRERVSRFEDRVAPGAGRATARINERRKKWRDSPTRRRTESARARARAAADKLAQVNSPVLAEPGAADHS